VPKMMVRKAEDVPAPDKTTKAVREQQQLYEGFIAQAKGSVGELSLAPGEELRSVKVRVRRAATRIGTELEIWDADGKVYFTSPEPTPKRGRPRKAS